MKIQNPKFINKSPTRGGGEVGRVMERGGGKEGQGGMAGGGGGGGRGKHSELFLLTIGIVVFQT